MVISRCCKVFIYVHGTPDGEFYVCGKCLLDCETTCRPGKENDDARNDFEIEVVP